MRWVNIMLMIDCHWVRYLNSIIGKDNTYKMISIIILLNGHSLTHYQIFYLLMIIPIRDNNIIIISIRDNKVIIIYIMNNIIIIFIIGKINLIIIMILIITITKIINIKMTINKIILTKIKIIVMIIMLIIIYTIIMKIKIKIIIMITYTHHYKSNNQPPTSNLTNTLKLIDNNYHNSPYYNLTH